MKRAKSGIKNGRIKARAVHAHNAMHHCVRCKRRIWVEESVKAGMGKICREKGLGSEVSAELAGEFAKLASQIMNEQKTGHPAPFRKALHDAFTKPKAHSSRAKWLENQRKLKEGW